MKKIAQLLTVLALVLSFAAPAHADTTKPTVAPAPASQPLYDPCPWC